jgi:formylglycine-generating enzyme required for sulfatase activity
MLALCLAAEQLEGWEAAGVQRLGLERLGSGWKAGKLLPIRIILREFAVAKLEATDPAERLWEFFLTTLPSLHRDALAPKLRQHLMENGGMFILDGYDEAPEAERHRERVKESVEALAANFPKARILLTSRIYAYQRIGKNEWRLPDFSDSTLAPFSRSKQEEFADRWYDWRQRALPGFSEEEAKGCATRFKAELNDRPDLQPVAERPLLLTLMASLHSRGHGQLPEGREGLYEKSVELLLEQWQRPKQMLDREGNPRLMDETADQFLKVSPARVVEALERLAFDAHRDQEKREGEADITAEQLANALLSVTGRQDLQPRQVVAYVENRAGLLNDVGGGIYRFPHRTFQEYLAARRLSVDGFPGKLAGLIRKDPGRWREAFLLAGAKVARGTPFAAWSLIECVIEPHPKSETEWTAAAVAGQLLVENPRLTESPHQTDERKATRLRKILARLLDKGHLPPVERAQAGRWLAKLGDPRPGVGLTPDGLPDIVKSLIVIEPPGEDGFLMGEGDQQFACKWIEEPYAIGKYPVTVAQFGAFLKAGGYEKKEFWTDDGWKWRDERGCVGPEDYDSFTDANQPRTGVTWYEAWAFCRWLKEETGRPFTLPTDAQWEFAVRGADGRKFPWGEEFDANAANTHEAGVGRTSAVGMFPSGLREGCEARDLAGNVWEWQLTKWHKEHRKRRTLADEREAGTDARVLRGGSWDDDPDFVRCAFRYGNYPYSRNNAIGFRVCVSPFPPLTSESPRP